MVLTLEADPVSGELTRAELPRHRREPDEGSGRPVEPVQDRRDERRVERHGRSRLPGRAAGQHRSLPRRLPADRPGRERLLHHDQRVRALRPGRAVHGRAALRDVEVRRWSRPRERVVRDVREPPGRRSGASSGSRFARRTSRGPPGPISSTARCSSRAAWSGSSPAIRRPITTRSRCGRSRTPSSLDSPDPELKLRHRVVNTLPYQIPPPSTQRPGDLPLGECLNMEPCLSAFGPPPSPQGLSVVDSLDGRMLGTWFADGDLWFSLGTAVEVGGQDQAGILYGAIEPSFKKGKLRGRVEVQRVPVGGGQQPDHALGRRRCERARLSRLHARSAPITSRVRLWRRSRSAARPRR